MAIERTEIVEEGQRRRAVYRRFVTNSVDRAMAVPNVRAQIDQIVEARLAEALDAMVKRRIDQQRREVEMLHPDVDRVPIRTIVEAVSEVTDTKLSKMLSVGRGRPVAWPRHLAFWLVRELRPDLSLPTIGKAFQRDHTTIIAGCRNILRRRESAPFKEWLAHPAIVALLAPRSPR